MFEEPGRDAPYAAKLALPVPQAQDIHFSRYQTSVVDDLDDFADQRALSRNHPLRSPDGLFFVDDHRPISSRGRYG